MIHVPYSVQFVTTLDENHPVAKTAIEKFGVGDELADMLAEMLVEFLDKHFAEVNNGWTWARVDTLDSLMKESENNLRETANA